MNPTEHNSVRLSMMGLLVAGCLTGCASDVASEQTIVGSNVIAEHETPVSVLETLRLRLPFKVSLRNGDMKKVVLRGEDNLIDQISVDENPVRSWHIMAPLDLKYLQHVEIEIEVPFIDMVEVRYNDDNVRLIDQPGSFMREAADATTSACFSGDCARSARGS